jgi:hypothetical protein
VTHGDAERVKGGAIALEAPGPASPRSALIHADAAGHIGMVTPSESVRLPTPNSGKVDPPRALLSAAQIARRLCLTDAEREQGQ